MCQGVIMKSKLIMVVFFKQHVMVFSLSSVYERRSEDFENLTLVLVVAMNHWKRCLKLHLFSGKFLESITKSNNKSVEFLISSRYMFKVINRNTRKK